MAARTPRKEIIGQSLYRRIRLRPIPRLRTRRRSKKTRVCKVFRDHSALLKKVNDRSFSRFPRIEKFSTSTPYRRAWTRIFRYSSTRGIHVDKIVDESWNAKKALKKRSAEPAIKGDFQTWKICETGSTSMTAPFLPLPRSESGIPYARKSILIDLTALPGRLTLERSMV